MKRVGGTIRATAAAMSVGIGFLPDYIEFINGTTGQFLRWNIQMMRLAACLEGIQPTSVTDADGLPNLLTFGNGITLFNGLATPLTADSTVYHTLDSGDHRKDAAAKTGITTWTLQSSANRTGKFNADVDTNINADGRAGARVEIMVGNTKYVTYIAALSNDGDADNDVTLAHLVQSGDVIFLGSPYDYSPALEGEIVSPGFSIAAAIQDLNDTAGELIIFEAGTYV